MEPQDRAQRYFEFLKAEGYLPRMMETGDVGFKSEGFNLIVRIDPGDDGFFQVLFPGASSALKDATEKQRALEACDEVNKRIKVAKLFLLDDVVYGSIELFLSTPDSYKAQFVRLLSALHGSARLFHDYWVAQETAPDTRSK